MGVLCGPGWRKYNKVESKLRRGWGTDRSMGVVIALLATAVPAALSLPRQALTRGVLKFGAAKGPSTWIVERDGAWSPNYWVEVKGGKNDGKAFVVPPESIELGLKEGDTCDLVLGDSEQPLCVKLPLNDAPSSLARHAGPGIGEPKLGHAHMFVRGS